MDTTMSTLSIPIGVLTEGKPRYVFAHVGTSPSEQLASGPRAKLNSTLSSFAGSVATPRGLLAAPDEPAPAPDPRVINTANATATELFT